MDRFAKIIDNPHLIRDMHTQAVLTTDPVLVRRHEKRVKDLQRADVMDREIRTLKTEIIDLKACVAQLLNCGIKRV